MSEKGTVTSKIPKHFTESTVWILVGIAYGAAKGRQGGTGNNRTDFRDDGGDRLMKLDATCPECRYKFTDTDSASERGLEPLPGDFTVWHQLRRDITVHSRTGYSPHCEKRTLHRRGASHAPRFPNL